jgi:hypothetical protein
MEPEEDLLLSNGRMRIRRKQNSGGTGYFLGLDGARSR